MAQTKAQKKRAIEGKKRNTVKSGKYKGWNVEITKTSNGKKCQMCGKNYHDFGDYSGYCPKCAKGFYKELQNDMDSQDEHDAKIQKLKDQGLTHDEIVDKLREDNFYAHRRFHNKEGNVV